MVIAQFESLKFGISSSTALLLKNIKMSAECEVETMTDNSQQFVSAKNGKPLQITFTAIFDANLGSDVKGNVAYLMNAAQRSLQSYFYIAGAKVFPFKMILVKADTEEIKLSPSGEWVKTNVSVVLKQSTKDWITENPAPENTGGGAGSTTPAKASVKTNGWVTAVVTGGISAAAAWIGSKTPASAETTATSTADKVAAASASKVTNAVSDASAVISTAKAEVSIVPKAAGVVSSAITGLLSKISSAKKK